MRVYVIGAVIAALLSAAAYSQEGEEKPTSLRTKAQKNEDAAIERAYQDMIGRTKEQAKSAPGKMDPWQKIRNAPTDSAKR
jgi:hypothetical protein